MADLQEFFDTIKTLRKSLENVSQDIDPQHSREKIQQDMNDLTTKFQELKSKFSKINQKDKEKLQNEAQELIQEKQNFLEYARDVNATLAKLRSRAENNTEAQEKIKQYLPRNYKREGVNSFFEKLSRMMNEISGWSEKVTK